MAILTVTEVSGQQPSAALSKTPTSLTGDSYPYSKEATLLLDNTDAAAQSVTITGGNEPVYGCALSMVVNLDPGECKVVGQLLAGWSVGGSVNLVSTDVDVLASVFVITE